MAPNAQKHPPGSRQTMILVNNLHCPSCVVNIEETLSALDPPPLSISTSIVLHEIKFVHPDTLSSSRIIRSLADAAFEIDSVLPSNEKLDDAPRSNPPKTDLQKLHIQKCDECALPQETPPSGVSSSTEVEALSKKTTSQRPLYLLALVTSISHPSTLITVLAP